MWRTAKFQSQQALATEYTSVKRLQKHLKTKGDHHPLPGEGNAIEISVYKIKLCQHTAHLF